MGGMDGGFESTGNERELREKAFFDRFPNEDDFAISHLEVLIAMERQITEGNAIRVGAFAIVGAEVNAESVEKLKEISRSNPYAVLGAVVICGERTQLNGRDHNNTLDSGAKLKSGLIQNSVLSGKVSISGRTSIINSYVFGGEYIDTTLTDCNSVTSSRLRNSVFVNSRLEYCYGSTNGIEVSGNISYANIAGTSNGQVLINPTRGR